MAPLVQSLLTDNRILAAAPFIRGAKAAGIKNVRVIKTNGSKSPFAALASQETKRSALALADNRTGDLSEWDAGMLLRSQEPDDISDWFTKEDLDELFNLLPRPPLKLTWQTPMPSPMHPGTPSPNR